MSFLKSLVSPVIGAVGSILGAKISSNSRPDPEYSAALQSQTSLEHERASFNQKMALAKEHGLHPLSVLGVPMSTFAPAVSTGPTADFSDLGYHAGNIASAALKEPEKAAEAVSEDPVQSRLVDAQVRLAEANAKRAEWDALRSEWTAVDLLRGQPGNPPRTRTSNDTAGIVGLAAQQSGVGPSLFKGGQIELKQEVLPPHPSILGHGAGAEQSFIRGVDQSGNFYSTLNPNLFSLDYEQPGTFQWLAKHYGPERASEIMAVIEQAPMVGGAVGALGYAGAKAYQYFAKQREEALKRRMNPRVYIQPRPEPYRPQWRGRGND